MNHKKYKYFLFISLFFLAVCAKELVGVNVTWDLGRVSLWDGVC